MPTSTTPRRRRRLPRKKSAAAIIVAIIVALVGYFTQQHRSPSSTTTPQTTSRETTRSSSENSRTQAAPKNTTSSRTTATTTPAPKATSKDQAASLTLDDGGIAELFRKQESDTWVEATGRVERLLADDNDGDRHQKFLMAVSDELTVLVSHNIDAAQRVPVKEGDYVRLRGEYEYSEKGGVVHFTHKPKFQRKAPGGWIEHQGTRYE